MNLWLKRCNQTFVIGITSTDKREGIIRTSYKNKRGVYLWTNKINGHQYIGSSMNLSSRLSDYFRIHILNINLIEVVRFL